MCIRTLLLSPGSQEDFYKQLIYVSEETWMMLACCCRITCLGMLGWFTGWLLNMLRSHKGTVTARDHGFILVCNCTVRRGGVGPLHRPEARHREFKWGYDSANCSPAPINTTRAEAGLPNQRDINKSHWLSINFYVWKVRSMGGYQDMSYLHIQTACILQGHIIDQPIHKIDQSIHSLFISKKTYHTKNIISMLYWNKSAKNSRLESIMPIMTQNLNMYMKRFVIQYNQWLMFGVQRNNGFHGCMYTIFSIIIIIIITKAWLTVAQTL